MKLDSQKINQKISETNQKKTETESQTLISKKSNHNEGRSNFMLGFIGTNRTGKSVTASTIANAWRKKYREKTIISFDPQNRFKEITDVSILLTDDDWEYSKVLKYRHALIILDDYYLVHSKLQASKGLREIMAFRAEYDYDFIYICHNPSLIINFLTFFTTHYFIFKTNAQEGSFKKKIPNYSLCESASRLINRYVIKNGGGSYPNFPHIVVDNDKNEMYAQNCNKELFKEISNIKK